MNPIKRFWSKTKVVGSCIERTISIGTDGYGKFSTTANGVKRHWRAHRWIYAQVCGDPGSQLVMHSCDNRRCVSLQHLSAGSQLANHRDAIAKGRHTSTPGRSLRARLTWNDVCEIRSSDEQGVMLAVRFGVTPAAISAIRHFRVWKTPPEGVTDGQT